MTSCSTVTDADKGRKKEIEKLANRDKSALGSLDFIDELPESPVPRGIPFPYSGDGKPRPIGWGGWQQP